MSIDPTRYVEVSANGTPNDPQATADLAAAAQAGAVAGDIAGRAAGAEAGAASGTEVASAAGAAAGAAAGELAGTAAGTASGATAGAVAGASAGGPAGAAAATALLNTRSITGGGLATGGGTLAADRVITVAAASQAEAETGTATTVAMTPQRSTQHFNARVSTFMRTVTAAADQAGALALLGAVSLATLALPSGAGSVGFSHATSYGPGTIGQHARAAVFVTDAPYNAVGDGVANDAPAFLAAIAALPAEGGEIFVPKNPGYNLAAEVPTGTKKVVWRIGATTILCPPGAFGLTLQSNGSQIVGSGRWATIFKLRAPASPLVMPTVVTALTGGALSSATPSGGSGFVTTPVAIVANSPTVSDTAASDAAVIATVSGGTVSSLAVVAGGAGYVANPAVTFLGGGAGAIKIDGIQSAVVCNLSIDFSNVPNSVGVYHYGGWFADITNIDRIYNVATGVSSESATSVGLVVDSHTDGVPGPTGSFGGVYVCRYSNIFFGKRALIGHDTSTGTTLQFSTCDFKNSYIHGCVGVTEVNPVQQAPAGTDNYHLVNVDGLTLLGGDVEDAGTVFHVHGSCNNIRVLNTLMSASTGPLRRGPLGTGWIMDGADPTNPDAPWRTGSGGSAGQRFQNTGWNMQHGLGIDRSGDTYTVGATNAKAKSPTTLDLYDTTANGIVLETSSDNSFRGRFAYAGANPRTTTDLFAFTPSGLDVPAVYVNGTKVVGARDTGWTAATGTGNKGAFAAAPAGTASAAYVQAEMQSALNRIAALEARVKSYDAAMFAAGSIGS